MNLRSSETKVALISLTHGVNDMYAAISERPAQGSGIYFLEPGLKPMTKPCAQDVSKKTAGREPGRFV